MNGQYALCVLGTDSVHPTAKPGDAKDRAQTRLTLPLTNAHNVLSKPEQDIQTMTSCKEENCRSHGK